MERTEELKMHNQHPHPSQHFIHFPQQQYQPLPQPFFQQNYVHPQQQIVIPPAGGLVGGASYPQTFVPSYEYPSNPQGPPHFGYQGHAGYFHNQENLPPFEMIRSHPQQSWNSPQETCNWTEHIDGSTGKKFYYNKISHLYSWETPKDFFTPTSKQQYSQQPQFVDNLQEQLQNQPHSLQQFHNPVTQQQHSSSQDLQISSEELNHLIEKSELVEKQVEPQPIRQFSINTSIPTTSSSLSSLSQNSLSQNSFENMNVKIEENEHEHGEPTKRIEQPQQMQTTQSFQQG